MARIMFTTLPMKNLLVRVKQVLIILINVQKIIAPKTYTIICFKLIELTSRITICHRLI